MDMDKARASSSKIRVSPAAEAQEIRGRRGGKGEEGEGKWRREKRKAILQRKYDF